MRTSGRTSAVLILPLLLTALGAWALWTGTNPDGFIGGSGLPAGPFEIAIRGASARVRAPEVTP
jgi:hypothetical protein